MERQYGNFNPSNRAPESWLFLGMSTQLGAGLSTPSNVAKALPATARRSSSMPKKPAATPTPYWPPWC